MGMPRAWLGLSGAGSARGWGLVSLGRSVSRVVSTAWFGWGPVAYALPIFFISSASSSALAPISSARSSSPASTACQ